MCPEEDSASVEWARQKDENWVNKDITSLEFVENMDVACSIIAICMGADQSLMPRKISLCVFQPDGLSRILTGKNQYEQENCSMNLKCRLYRNKWVQSITVSDVMESGQVVENPMIGAIPSRNEVQRELDDLLMSM